MIIASYTMVGNTLYVLGHGYCDIWPLRDIMMDGYIKDKVFEQFQSTHPHGVRLITPNLCYVILFVSIHAPAWGATASIVVIFFSSCFNPRTRMGCDNLRGRVRLHPRGFNPRTRMGCDSLFVYFLVHAKSFNPRTRMGCDIANNTETPMNIGFQSTHPHGVRPPI